MQHYAFDLLGALVFAKSAEKQKDYLCPECQGIVRLRGGLHRQDHFYHLELSPDCRQNGKSAEHLNIQLYFLNMLPEGECFLEYRFPTIRRIADVVWLPNNLIFEIQCSPISAEEVLERNRDYLELGFQVIWIFHDQRFNQTRVSGAEAVLYELPHYFTNIDAEGEGMIYDQFALVRKGWRSSRLSELPVDLSRMNRASECSFASCLDIVACRLRKFSFYFSGDLVDLAINGPFHGDMYRYLEAAMQAEKTIKEKINVKQETRLEKLGRLFSYYILRPYRLLLQFLLERACK
ncbi:MAG: competence protein CoiA [Parachlamydiaceae bacterium]